MSLILTLFLSGAGLAMAQQPQASPPAPPSKPCAAPEYRQFDFWLGSWEVRNPQSEVAGSNRIASILGGCVLEEDWSGRSGMVGKSFNIYSPADRQWHQTWVDSNGLLLQLAGNLKDGKMVLAGEGTTHDGRAVVNRITWQPLAEGRVRQLWEQTGDQGATWKVVFDGLYSKKN